MPDLHTRNLLLIPTPSIIFRDIEIMVSYAQARKNLVDIHPADLTASDIQPMSAFFSEHKIAFNAAIKLADFGSAFLANDGGDKNCTGKIRWDVKSPQRLEDKAWNLPADIWALGCTIIELFIGKQFMRGPPDIPWRQWTNEILLEVVRGRLADPAQGVHDSLNGHGRSDITSAELSSVEEMAVGMLREWPEDRLKADEVQSAWQAFRLLDQIGHT
jgi:serine/threonine protein kinase